MTVGCGEILKTIANLRTRLCSVLPVDLFQAAADGGLVSPICLGNPPFNRKVSAHTAAHIQVKSGAAIVIGRYGKII